MIAKVLIRWGREGSVQEGDNGIIFILPLTVEFFFGEDSRSLPAKVSSICNGSSSSRRFLGFTCSSFLSCMGILSKGIPHFMSNVLAYTHDLSCRFTFSNMVGSI